MVVADGGDQRVLQSVTVDDIPHSGGLGDARRENLDPHGAAVQGRGGPDDAQAGELPGEACIQSLVRCVDDSQNLRRGVHVRAAVHLAPMRRMQGQPALEVLDRIQAPSVGEAMVPREIVMDHEAQPESAQS